MGDPPHAPNAPVVAGLELPGADYHNLQVRATVDLTCFNEALYGSLPYRLEPGLGQGSLHYTYVKRPKQPKNSLTIQAPASCKPRLAA